MCCTSLAIDPQNDPELLSFILGNGTLLSTKNKAFINIEAKIPVPRHLFLYWYRDTD